MIGFLSSPTVHRSRSGVTLIELLVVLLIMLLIAGGISRLLLSAWESQDTIATQNEMQRRAQLAADAVVDRMRGASEIVSGDATQVIAAFENEDTVRYYLQGAELRRDTFTKATNQTVAGSVICRDVGGLNFGYLVRSGATWAAAASASLAESVQVSVTVASGSDRATETSVVKLRNRT